MSEVPLAGEIGVATVDYPSLVRAAAGDPRRLEELYQTARDGHAVDRFTAALLACYQERSDNLLYAAWYYRLQHAAPDEPRILGGAHWRQAVPVSIALALALWLLSDPRWALARGVPYLAVLWAPTTALALIAFLTWTAGRGYLRAVLLGVGLVAVTAYVLALTLRAGPATQMTYLDLMLLHLPLLSGAAVGFAVLGWGSSSEDRFAFLTKSIETIGTAGVASIAGGIFVGLTYGMFEALSVDIPQIFIRLLVAGGAGLIPVLAVASVYEPTLGPSAQEFRRGFGKILGVLMRALLPLTLLVLVIYLGVVPFNFMQPFVNRDVLIVFNVLLFAIMGLLIGITPLSLDDVPERFRVWLRGGILALAGLVALVSLYALAAIVYRTAAGQLTMNRVVVIGWNVVNIGILLVLLFRQLRAGRQGWVDALHGAFGLGTVLYVGWAVLLTLALPWVF